MGKMAILVDGGFYLRRAHALKGEKTPKDRAKELVDYCKRHVEHEDADLYRIYYYDCDPIGKKVYHPYLDRTIDLSKQPAFSWKNDFFKELSAKRKLAVRKGEELDGGCEYVLKKEVSRDIVRGKRTIEDISEQDFVLDVRQKGIDVRIGLDLALIAHRRFADQVVLITGDSDFVPAAKYARRNGLDFILDPMWHPFRPELGIHVDGLYTPWPNQRKSQ